MGLTTREKRRRKKERPAWLPGMEPTGPPAQPVRTSIEAAQRIEPHAATMRGRVYAYIAGRDHGATRNEIAVGLKMKLQTVCGRCHELLELKLIYQSDEARGGGKVLRAVE